MGNSASLAVFPKRGGKGGKHAVRFPRFPSRGSFHSLRSKKTSVLGRGRKLGPYSSSDKFFAACAWHRCGGAISGLSAHHGCGSQLSFCAPTARAKLQYMTVMQQAIERGAHGRSITQQFALFHRPIGRHQGTGAIQRGPHTFMRQP